MRLCWKIAAPPDETALAHLSPERRARVLRCRDAQTAAGIAAAGLLLAEHVAPNGETILKTETGKPYLPDGPEFSLSHGGTLAALLLADTPCGVDVEPVERTVPPRVQAWVLRPEERICGRAFAWLWTRKEAVMKLDGRGLGLDAQSFSVLDARLRLDGRELVLATQLVRGHFISVAYCI